MSKAILTCALNGVLTDPRRHPMVPVTPEQMAQSAREAFDAGASIVHVHFRCQSPGMGHLPSWEPQVAAGMPVDADLLALLLNYHAAWQTTLIGRTEIWPVHQRAAELGGMLRTGLEDTFYLPSGEKAVSNGALIEALARCARNAGREIASAQEARTMLHLGGATHAEHGATLAS